MLVCHLDLRSPPGHAHRPEAFAKKSRSTSNCPILACNFSISASLASLGRLVASIEQAGHAFHRLPLPRPDQDRKSVVKGKSVSVSCDLGDRRHIHKKKNITL